MHRIALFLALLGVLSPRPASAISDHDTATVELVTFTTAYGVGLGAFTSQKFDLSLRPAAWLTSGVAGGALYGGLKASQAADVTLPQARLTVSAGLWSALDSVLLMAAVDELQGDGPVYIMFGTAAAASTGAFFLASSLNASEGQISLVNSGGVFGPAAGLLLGVTLHLGDGEHLARDVLLLQLLGMGAATWAAHAYDPSRTQVLYLDAGLLAGGLIGGLVGTIGGVAADSYEVATAMTLIGMGTGAFIAVSRNGFGGDDDSDDETPSEKRVAVMFPLWSGAF